MAEADAGVRFGGFLGVSVDDESFTIPIGRLDVSETYNAGWRGRAVLTGTVRPGITSSRFMGTMMAKGVVPGSSANVYVTIRSRDSQGQPDELDGQVMRTWPVVLGAVEPVETGQVSVAGCSVQIMDPVTFLDSRAIWGAYRGCSVAEMVGGALSMAAGGEGGPTLTPPLPGLPAVTVTATYRESLEWMQYAIAAGQPLGVWLGEVAGLLALRMELIGRNDGTVVLQLTDKPAMGQEVESRVAGAGEELRHDDDGRTPVEVTGLYSQPSTPLRAAVLDDITQGAFRRVGGGSVANVIQAFGVDADEVAARMLGTQRGRSAEMFVVSAASTQPGFRPGRRATFDKPLMRVTQWQVAGVRHRMRGEAYSNSLTMFDARIPWVPTAPSSRPDIIVPAAIDGGEDLALHQPVPRDRMGRIPVRFPFLPVNTAEERDAKDDIDAKGDGDGDVTLADFGDNFSDTEHWESEVESFRAGVFDDPYPGRRTDELGDDERIEREQQAARRRGVRQYFLYLDLKAREGRDRDQDGYVTHRDDLVSDRLQEVLADEESREEFLGKYAQFEAARDSDDIDSTGSTELSEDDLALLSEYDNLFGPEADQSDDVNVRRAAMDANAAAERWPARLPLPVVNPMAGGLHGFIPSHRQGDACRVAVHGPFSAEVIGFQYRDDRPINQEIEGATAGFVVEHDLGKAWSGLVFRPTEDVEEK